MKKKKCDCHLHKNQVCDICQKVVGKKMKDKVVITMCGCGRHMVIKEPKKKDPRNKINKFVESLGFDETDEILLADGFENAFVGIACQFNKPMACYDYDECITVLLAEGMTEEDAIEHMSFNVEGGWVGEKTPLFLRCIKKGA